MMGDFDKSKFYRTSKKQNKLTTTTKKKNKTLLLQKLFQKIRKKLLNSFYVIRITLIPKTFSELKKQRIRTADISGLDLMYIYIYDIAQQ